MISFLRILIFSDLSNFLKVCSANLTPHITALSFTTIVAFEIDDLGINTFDVISPSLPMSSKRAVSISWFIYFLVNNFFMICVISQI